METTYHEHDPLIAAIGGDIIRSRLSISSQSLYNWRVRGVPDIKRLAVANLAAEKGVPVPADFLAPLGA